MQENSGKKRKLQLLPHNINFQNMYSLGKLELTNVKRLLFSWKPNFSNNSGSRLHVLKRQSWQIFGCLYGWYKWLLHIIFRPDLFQAIDNCCYFPLHCLSEITQAIARCWVNIVLSLIYRWANTGLHKTCLRCQFNRDRVEAQSPSIYAWYYKEMIIKVNFNLTIIGNNIFVYIIW